MNKEDFWIEEIHGGFYIFKMVGNWDNACFRGSLVKMSPDHGLDRGREYPFNKELSRKLETHEYIKYKLLGII